MYKSYRVSAVIPAFNEELAIGKVVSELIALKTSDGSSAIDEIVVCDNASSDLTGQRAAQCGAKVVYQQSPGYGIACLTALKHIGPCDIVLFVDGDDSCFVGQAFRLLDGIVAGDDVAIGSRVLGHVETGALTSVQLFGNALSAWLIRLFWQRKISDLGPFRAIRSSALKQIDMKDRTFGWTVEMQIKAIQLRLRMNEYPVDSKVRIGESKISGTFKGAALAGIGILSKIVFLRLEQDKLRLMTRLENS
ncbi:MAG: glycosyltransferase involved in cell wall biosynthesis [Halioglobus sp.]|jgi:glycosyltransferase involved in cell wall biosynthesis